MAIESGSGESGSGQSEPRGDRSSGTEGVQPTARVGVRTYAEAVFPLLYLSLEKNAALLETLADRLVDDVQGGRKLLVFGSGHSALFPMELYHRAGGASFVLPLVADYLLPSAGPSVVRVLERTPSAALPLLDRFGARPGEMLWLSSQSGINGASVELALEAKKRGIFTVAFTNVAHSRQVASRHPSGQRLFEVCDACVDIGGVLGDALVPVPRKDLKVGPASSLLTILLGHSVIVAAAARLEEQGISCVYTSVNTPAGDSKNRELEKEAAERDYLLR